MERLHKFLARAGVDSRRNCEELMLAGRVTVNGRVQRELGSQIDPDADDIQVDGKRIMPPSELHYVILHKPRNVITSMYDPEGRETVADLIDVSNRLFPVGRLDYDSEGLLLMTDDGDLSYRLTHPSFEIEKEYHALLDVMPNVDQLRQWRAGVELDDGKTAPAWVEVLEEAFEGVWVRVVIHEGRNRQVRRVAEALGLHVRRLIRVREGNLTLNDLQAGQWRSLTPSEITALRLHARRSKARLPIRPYASSEPDENPYDRPRLRRLERRDQPNQNYRSYYDEDNRMPTRRKAADADSAAEETEKPTRRRRAVAATSDETMLEAEPTPTRRRKAATADDAPAETVELEAKPTRRRKAAASDDAPAETVELESKPTRRRKAATADDAEPASMEASGAMDDNGDRFVWQVGDVTITSPDGDVLSDVKPSRRRRAAAENDAESASTEVNTGERPLRRRRTAPSDNFVVEGEDASPNDARVPLDASAEVSEERPRRRRDEDRPRFDDERPRRSRDDDRPRRDFDRRDDRPTRRRGDQERTLKPTRAELDAAHESRGRSRYTESGSPARSRRDDRGGFGGRDDRPRRDFGDRPRRDDRGGFGGRDDRPRRDFDDRPRRDFGDRPPRDDRGGFGGRDDRPRRDFGDRPRRDFGDRSFDRRDDRPRRDFDDRPRRDFGDRPPRDDRGGFGGRDDRPRRDFGDRDDRPRRDFGDRPRRDFGDRDDRPRRDFGDRPRRDDRRDDRPRFDREDRPRRDFPERPTDDREEKLLNAQADEIIRDRPVRKRRDDAPRQEANDVQPKPSRERTTTNDEPSARRPWKRMSASRTMFGRSRKNSEGDRDE